MQLRLLVYVRCDIKKRHVLISDCFSGHLADCVPLYRDMCLKVSSKSEIIVISLADVFWVTMSCFDLKKELDPIF